MDPVKQKSTYRILMRTIWREDDISADECGVYLFRLEDPRTGERRGFTDAASLFSAISEIIVLASGGEGGEHGDEQSDLRV